VSRAPARATSGKPWGRLRYPEPEGGIEFRQGFLEREGNLDDTNFLMWNNVLSEMDERVRDGVLIEWDIDGIEGLWWT
jgi:hypothetical protein